MAGQAPQVGELLLLDGRMRRISHVNLDTNIVEFVHPQPEEEERRATTMAAWKARRAEWTANYRQNVDAEISDEAVDAAFRMEEPPPELSRNGAVGIGSLDWMDGANFWAVRDRIDGRKFRLGTTVLTPAAATLSGNASEG